MPTINSGVDASKPPADESPAFMGTTHQRWITLMWALGALGSSGPAAGGSATSFLVGADLSHVGFFEARGKEYREGGVPADPFAILARHGLGYARLRLFTGTAKPGTYSPYNSINDLTYALPLAVRAQRAGLKVWLDLHYSDTWADPGRQTKPEAWRGLSFEDLVQQVETYSRDTLRAFAEAGAPPDIVQVGNEIVSGMLWPDGKVGGSYDNPAQWTKLGRLLRAAIRGVEQGAGAARPRVTIHIDRGGSWGGTQWFFDNLAAQQVPFDLISQSYYPWWHGTLDDLRRCLTNTANRYRKPIVIAETAFPWVTTNWNGTAVGPQAGIPPGPGGQVRFAETLADILKALPNGLGLGLVWWGAEYQALTGENLAGFEGRSFFDRDGNALPIVAAVGRLGRPVFARPEPLPDRTLRLTVTGPRGQVLALESSTALRAWHPVATNTNTAGMTVFTAPTLAVPSQFFRAREW